MSFPLSRKALFGALALGSLIYAGISGEEYGYATWWIIALFVIAALAGIAFVLVEQGSVHIGGDQPRCAHPACVRL